MSSLLRLSEDQRREALAELVDREWGARLGPIEAIAPGLGNRRFFRLGLAGQSAPATSVIARVEADEDPAKRAVGAAPEPPLEPLRRFLEDAGIPVPRRFAADRDLGVELLEDAGDESLERAARQATGELRFALYRETCAWIPRLQALENPKPPLEAFSRRLDRTLFESKATRVVDWALPYWLGRDAKPSEREVVREVFDLVAQHCDAAPARLSHRDLKAANVHFVPTPEGGRRIVLIDLQGAFLAPPEYDLVCLLRDSHVRLAWDEVVRHLDEIRPDLPDAPTPETFMERFTLLTLTRVAKDAAHYIHAFTSNADRRYLSFLPTAREVLREAAERAAPWHPALEPLAELFAELREP
ncbi:MAG: phosphotransferase [bacterium]|nr:phosphotransferase [bacterium]